MQLVSSNAPPSHSYPNRVVASYSACIVGQQLKIYPTRLLESVSALAPDLV